MRISVRGILRAGAFTVLVASLAAAGFAGSDPEAPLRLRATGDVRALERVGDSLWIGTTGGLFIYDLGNDELLDASAIEARLPRGAVRAIRAKADSVLIGTDGGLAVFAAGSLSVLTPADYEGIPLERIRAIDVGLGGELFIATYGLGVGVIASAGNYEIVREDSLLDNKVYRTVQHDDTTFYYATSMGLCAFRDSLWVNFQAGAGIPRGEIREMVARGDGNYYLLVGDYGVYRFDGVNAQRVSKAGVFPENDISAITVDADGDLWAAGRFGGIAVYQNGRWKPTSKSDPKIWRQPWRCAAAGSESGVFFGAASGMVVAIERGHVRRIRVPGELDEGDVNCLTRDGNGVVYFLGGGRVARMTPKKPDPQFEPFPASVADLAVAPGGGLWAAGRWGVFRLDGGGFVEFDVDTGESDASYVALCFDDGGQLWVASRSGRVYRYDGLLWMRAGDVRSFGLDRVDRLIPGSGGGVWAFRFGGGKVAAALSEAQRWYPFAADSFGTGALVDAVRAPNGTVVALTARSIWGYDAVAEKWRRVGPPPRPGGGDSRAAALSAPQGEAFRCAAFDSGGRFFVGTERRVGVLTESGWRWIGADEGMSGYGPTTILAGDDAALWVGFERDGLLRLSGKSLW